MIELDRIGTNRYAPDGANAVYMYKAFEQDLTLGQLLVAVCMQAASVNEMRSVLYTNQLSDNSKLLTLMSTVANMVTKNDKVTWDDSVTDIPENYNFRSAEFASKRTVWNFFVYEAKVESKTLPAKLSDGNDQGYTRRLQAFSLLKSKMDDASRFNQRVQISLRSQVSRRDVSFATSSNLLKGFIGSMQMESIGLRLG